MSIDRSTLITNLTAEKQALETKIINLDTFLNDEAEVGVAGLELILLRSQFNIMESYKNHLEIRIGIAQEDLENNEEAS